MRGQAMRLADCVRLIHEARDDQLVITSMGVAREWMRLEPHPGDFHFVPSSMGQATSLALGIALARSDRRVLVCVGDGAMLMNLGSLVSVTAAAPENLTILLFDNGVYEVTGGQATAASAGRAGKGQAGKGQAGEGQAGEGRAGEGRASAGQTGAGQASRVDFAAVARGCGFSSVHPIDTLDDLRAALPQLLQGSGPSPGGPSLALLRVLPVPGAVGPKSPGPAAERARRLRQSLTD